MGSDHRVSGLRAIQIPLTEFVEGDSPVPSMFEPSGATVVSIDGPRIAALAQFLL